MPTRQPQLAKLTRPRLHKAVARERLFALLDEASEHKPAICIVGPPVPERQRSSQAGSMRAASKASGTRSTPVMSTSRPSSIIWARPLGHLAARSSYPCRY